MATVRVIPAKESKPTSLRVAAYCRVSSNSADQQHSYAAQIRNYTEEIGRHEGWELVDVYADEAVTGTKMDRRDDFNRMIADCRKGKIDRILVKSVSRFARNARDCLAVLRELTALGVGVHFEKENINSEALTSELMVSVSSALAQEESISISQNQRMSYRRRMERGEFITCKAPFGYRLPDGKNLEVIPEEAEQVRWIFDAYLSGISMDRIAEEMTRRGIPTTDGKPYWQNSTVSYVLTNEKYTGDTLCQKKYATSFPFEKRRNHSERDQYYVEHTHPAIISRDVFDRVQELVKQRSDRQMRPQERRPLTRKIRCGICGTLFVRRTMKDGHVCWVCRKHDHGSSNCPVGRIPEADIYAAFVRMYQKLRLHDDIVWKPLLSQLDELAAALQQDNPALLAINTEIAATAEQSHKIAKLRSAGLLDEAGSAEKLRDINARITTLRRERRTILKNDEIDEAAEALRQTADSIRSGPARLEDFDETLFADLVEGIVAESQTRVRFRLYGGLELTERLQGDPQ